MIERMNDETGRERLSQTPRGDSHQVAEPGSNLIAGLQLLEDGDSFAIIIWQPNPASLNATLNRLVLGRPTLYQGYPGEITHVACELTHVLLTLLT